MVPGADLEGGRGGGGRTASGIRPPADPKVPPLHYIHFWRTDPKIFLKVPLAPINTNCKGGAQNFTFKLVKLGFGVFQLHFVNQKVQNFFNFFVSSNYSTKFFVQLAFFTMIV